MQLTRRKLKSFRVAQLAYDVTVRFCDRYIEKRSRTRDQNKLHEEAVRALLPRFEAKIQRVLDRVWGNGAEAVA